MANRVSCKKLFCRNSILEETAKANDGLCAPCYQRKYPDAKKTNNYQRLNEVESSVPASELSDRQKRRQLENAVRDNDTQRFSELLDDGNDFIANHDGFANTFLSAAISMKASIPLLDKLQSNGCLINPTREVTNTAVEAAVSNEQYETIQWLLDKGADPNIGRPVIGAINHRLKPESQLKMLSLLLKSGADINKTYPLYGDENNRFSVLDWAVTYRISPPVIEFLKSHGAAHHCSNDTIAQWQAQLKPRRIVP